MYVEEGGYLTNQAYMKQKTNEMVSDSITAGIYVLIDWHIHADPTTFTTEASSFFNEMATQWGSYPNVIYEICNEPIGGVTWSTVKSYANIDHFGYQGKGPGQSHHRRHSDVVPGTGRGRRECPHRFQCRIQLSLLLRQPRPVADG